MNKVFAGFVCSLFFTAAAHATVQVEIDAGYLRNATGTAFVPVGGLLQLIASPSGNATFPSPTANSFVSGDNIIVASFAMNYASVTNPGETDNVVTFTLANTGAASATMFDAGDPLILRWYPTLTYSSTTNYANVGPGALTTFGQGRSATAADGGAAFITPSDGSNGTAFVFITSDNGGGSQSIISGYAANVVLVPEPSSIVLLSCGLVGFASLLARRRHNRFVC